MKLYDVIRISCLWVILFHFYGCVNTKEATSDLMRHEFIFQFPNISKDQIYEVASRWLAQNFRSAKQVIDYQDKQAGTIVAKGLISNFNYGAIMSGSLRFTLTIDIKEGKARFRYSNLELFTFQNERIYTFDDTEGVHLPARNEFNKINAGIVSSMGKKDDF